MRRSIVDIQADYDAGNKKEPEDLMRAWKEIEELGPNELRSFFMIGGFHGEPYRELARRRLAGGVAIASMALLCSRPGISPISAWKTLDQLQGEINGGKPIRRYMDISQFPK